MEHYRQHYFTVDYPSEPGAQPDWLSP